RTALAARPARGTPWTRRIRRIPTGRTTLPPPGPERSGRASIWACHPSGRVSIGAGRPSRPAAHGGRSPIRHSLHPVDTPVHDPTGEVPIEWIDGEGAGEGWGGWGLGREGRAHGYTGGGRMGIRGLASGVYDDGPAPLRVPGRRRAGSGQRKSASNPCPRSSSSRAMASPPSCTGP